jgi:5-methylcytosine-specific restriction endonuclease McrA
MTTNEQVHAAYRETGSVWAAGKLLGIAGQQVHVRLARMGVVMNGGGVPWTSEEEAELERLVNAGVPFLEIANRLNRSYNAIAVRASRLGFQHFKKSGRLKKIPRGHGYDKASMTRHVKDFLASPLTLTKFVKSVGLNIEPFVWAWQKWDLEGWNAYLSEHASDVPRKECKYCQEEFIPNSGKQEHCTRRCADVARRDASYFGGKRRETLGLAEGICQLCGRKPEKGLSSHHVLGKKNDQDNNVLIALCQGCHDVVSRLAGKPWIRDQRKLESLISFAYMQANGAALMASGNELYVFVEITETEPDDEDD